MADPDGNSQVQTKKVLILYYSFSGQTSGILNSLVTGLKENGTLVIMEKVRPRTPLRFPVGSIFGTFRMMLTTFLRTRVPIREPEINDTSSFDLVILAGPTWSYNPSGPILDLLDRYGKTFLAGKTVIPLISCRGYWRMHWFGLRRILAKCRANVPNHIVFAHPATEPWRTVGVFLKIAGKAPERSRMIGQYYTRFGHSKEQLAEAENFGKQIASTLQSGQSLGGLNFQTDIALP